MANKFLKKCPSLSGINDPNLWVDNQYYQKKVIFGNNK